MSVSIRLKRMGRRNHPFYRVVVADTLKKREGAYLENLGWYDPHASEQKYSLNLDRILYWKSHGARMSSTIENLVRKEGGFSGNRKTVVTAVPTPDEAPAAEAVSADAPAEASAGETTESSSAS